MYVHNVIPRLYKSHVRGEGGGNSMEQGINMYGANRESSVTSGVMHEVYAFIIK